MDIRSVSPAQLAELHEKNPRLELIDVRTPAEFEAVHVTYASNVPLDRLDAAALVQQRTGGANEPLYFVCQGGVRSRQACEKLAAAGLANVVNVEGGTKACVAAGLPVIRAKNAFPLERLAAIGAGGIVLAGAALGWWGHSTGAALAAVLGAGLLAVGATGVCPLRRLGCGAPDDSCCRKK